MKYLQKVSREDASIHNLEKRDYYLTKFNYKCNYCSDTKRLALDHIIPITKGGDNSENNIQVLYRQ